MYHQAKNDRVGTKGPVRNPQPEKSRKVTRDAVTKCRYRKLSK